jgi:hypothetical protein
MLPGMIDVKQAVKIAVEYFADLMGARANGALLEEVEIDDSGPRPYWKITLSVPEPLAPMFGVANIIGGKKDFKVVTIDAESGEVKSIKIRQLNAA